jgi:hypothetical protein
MFFHLRRTTPGLALSLTALLSLGCADGQLPGTSPPPDQPEPETEVPGDPPEPSDPNDPEPREPEADSEPTTSLLADGVYYYISNVDAESSSEADVPGQEYLVLETRSGEVLARRYTYASGDVSCFTGQLDGNTVVNREIAYRPKDTSSSGWHYNSADPKALGDWTLLDVADTAAQLPSDIATGQLDQCRAAFSEYESPQSPGAELPPSNPDEPAASTPFEGSTDPIGQIEDIEDADAGVLEDVRVAEHEHYERVVFEFRDALPQYRVTYLDRPARSCGSGYDIETAGEQVMKVSFAPASAFDDVDGERRKTVDDTELTPNLPLLQQLVETCDHHAGVSWALGTSEQVPFRVLALDNPGRLVVDLRRD